MRYRDLGERLLANSVPEHTGHQVNGEPSECWLWIGNVDSKGYGRLTIRRPGRQHPTGARAHRVAYEWFHRTELREVDTLEHECRQPRCIHPNHTTPMARAENTARMQAFWRNYRAEQAGQQRIKA